MSIAQILFKWTPDGWASELKRRSLGANEELSFVGWTEEMVRSNVLPATVCHPVD